MIGGGMLLGGGLSLIGSSKAAKGAERAAATSAGAQERGAEIAAQSQREALEYMKQREALPQHMREQALMRLGGVYGIPYSSPQQAGGQQPATAAAPELSQFMQQFAHIPEVRERLGLDDTTAPQPSQVGQERFSGFDRGMFRGVGGAIRDQGGFGGRLRAVPGIVGGAVQTATGAAMAQPTGEPFGQQDLIQQARTSPLYGAMMGGREAGEEAIMRRAGATGGLRSGNVQEAMYDYNTQLQNQALLQSYNQQLQGLQGLAGLPSYAPQIASGMAGVGQTLGAGITGAGTSRAQGQVASGQAWQQGLQGISNIIGSGMGQLADIYRPPGTIAGPRI
jgi:hypothetical protein